MERELITHYEQLINDVLLPNLNADNFATAVKIAKLPEEIRGYDVVKDQHIERVRVKEQQLLAEFRNPVQPQVVQFAQAG